MIEYTKSLEKEMRPAMIKLIKFNLARFGCKDRIFDFEELMSYSKFLLFEACNEYDETKGTKFLTFYWMKLNGKLINLLKRKKHRDEKMPIVYPEFDGSADYTKGDYGQSGSSPEHAIIEMLDLQRLNEMMGDEDWELYKMYHVEGYTIPEIIEIKGDITEATCKKKMRFIRVCHGEFMARDSAFIG